MLSFRYNESRPTGLQELVPVDGNSKRTIISPSLNTQEDIPAAFTIVLLPTINSHQDESLTSSLLVVDQESGPFGWIKTLV